MGTWLNLAGTLRIRPRTTFMPDGSYEVDDFDTKSSLVIHTRRGRYWIKQRLLTLDPEGDAASDTATFAIEADRLSLGARCPVGEHQEILGTWRLEHDVTEYMTDKVRWSWQDWVFSEFGKVAMTDTTEGSPPKMYEGEWSRASDGKTYRIRFDGSLQQPFDLTLVGGCLVNVDSWLERVDR
jgi:hypothetical protein